MAGTLAACGGGSSGSSSTPAAPPVLALVAGNTDEPGTADGPGAQARFRDADAIALDAAGTLFVSEGRFMLGWGAVRRIAPDGTVTTVMRTAPNTLEWLAGIDVDAQGNVYVARLGYCGLRCGSGTGPAQVLRILPTGATESLPLREPEASQVTRVQAFARDGSGALYLAGGSNVWRTAPDGSVSSVTSVVLAAIVGLDIEPSGSLVFATSNFTNPRSGALFRLASGSRTLIASFNDNPAGVAADGSGNLYVAFPESHVVRKIDAAGVMTTVAGVDGHRGFAAGPLPGLLDSPLDVAIRGRDLFIVMPAAVAVVHHAP